MFVYFLHLLHNIIMQNRKRTLPRHTLLASQGRRISSAIVDFALFIIISLAFYVCCFSLIIEPFNKENRISFQSEQINSGLLVEEEGQAKALNSKSSNEEFLSRLSYYYISYMSGTNVKEGLNACRYSDQYNYDVSWFNENILGLKDETVNESLFKYVTSGGAVDKSLIGVVKEGKEVEASSWLQEAYIYAYDSFITIDYVTNMQDSINFLITLEFVLGATMGALITYVFIPLGIKNGKTLGKKINKLSLANYEGYKLKDYQLLLRAVPLLLVLGSLLLPIWSNTFMLLAYILVIFLSSFAFAMASPKKASLHDLVARTIVIDDIGSIIFETPSEEEDYIFKEDGIEQDDNKVIEGDGEEPEISYEK